MRVLMLLSKEWGESRSRREARVLAAAGHEVSVLARNRGGAERHGREGDVRVERIPGFHHLGKRAARLLSVSLAGNPVWMRAAGRVVRSVRPEIVHLHDLPLGPLALRLARRRGVPLIYDLHENYPGMMAASARGLVRRGVVASGFWRRLERSVATQADALIVVCREQAARLAGLGVDPERIVIVGNTLEPERFDAVVSAARHSERVVLPELPGRRVVYSGIFGNNRGLDTLLRALAWTRDRGADLSLVLIGEGPMMVQLRALVDELALGDRVCFTGWIDCPRMLAVTGQCAIAVVPHLSDEHIETTYPNKIFEFMALGMPLVVSDAAPLRRIVVDEAGAGVAARSGDHADLGRSLLALAQDPGRCRRLGRAGRSSVEGRHHFRHDRLRLLALYEQLRRSAVARRPGAGRSSERPILEYENDSATDRRRPAAPRGAGR